MELLACLFKGHMTWQFIVNRQILGSWRGVVVVLFKTKMLRDLISTWGERDWYKHNSRPTLLKNFMILWLVSHFTCLSLYSKNKKFTYFIKRIEIFQNGEKTGERNVCVYILIVIPYIPIKNNFIFFMKILY